MSPFFIRWLVATLAVALVSSIPGTGIWADSLLSLIAAGLLLGVLNAVVRPVLLLLSLPFIVISLGIFVLFINAVMLLFVGGIVHGFHVAGFGSAFFSAILISLASWALNAFFRGSEGHIQITTARPVEPEQPTIKTVQGRVIK